MLHLFPIIINSINVPSANKVHPKQIQLQLGIILTPELAKFEYEIWRTI